MCPIKRSKFLQLHHRMKTNLTVIAQKPWVHQVHLPKNPQPSTDENHLQPPPPCCPPCCGRLIPTGGVQVRFRHGAFAGGHPHAPQHRRRQRRLETFPQHGEPGVHLRHTSLKWGPKERANQMGWKNSRNSGYISLEWDSLKGYKCSWACEVVY